MTAAMRWRLTRTASALACTSPRETGCVRDVRLSRKARPLQGGLHAVPGGQRRHRDLRWVPGDYSQQETIARGCWRPACGSKMPRNAWPVDSGWKTWHARAFQTTPTKKPLTLNSLRTRHCRHSSRNAVNGSERRLPREPHSAAVSQTCCDAPRVLQWHCRPSFGHAEAAAQASHRRALSRNTDSPRLLQLHKAALHSAKTHLHSGEKPPPASTGERASEP